MIQFFKARGIFVKRTKGEIGSRVEPTYALMFVKDRSDVVKIDGVRYLFLGFGEDTYETVQALSERRAKETFHYEPTSIDASEKSTKKKRYLLGFQHEQTSALSVIETVLSASQLKKFDRLTSYRPD
ncbi:hypothetical protein ACE1TH_16465 [Shouchella sp. JSM 1781072]|uniref:hypothetical protein n=1 Tax=Bacillaceae TaxID=186817 RepID=UPI0020D1817F|nr:hypothetical protein [Alkalihalobacillus sp. LMS6]UTR06192.1 hypothetical protein MM326_19290 [Alkalihalobacillus sp. LMS6]